MSGIVYTRNLLDMPWEEASRSGIWRKTVREDADRGYFLGALAFDEGARSGTHQHLGVASSFFVQGALTDYYTTTRRGDLGINLPGATHDAVAYERTVILSRLEGPAKYVSEEGMVSNLHTGATEGEVVAFAPEKPVDINVPVYGVPSLPTSIPRLSRRMLHDYSQVEEAGRCTALQLLPDCAIPPFKAVSPIDGVVIGGLLTLNGDRTPGGSMFCIDPGQSVEMASPYGAFVMVWSEGPIVWDDFNGPDPFGFD